LQPKNYLDFITNYKRRLASHRHEITETTTRLSNGLNKLIQAATEVDSLQQELTHAKVVVEAATKECNELLEVRSRSCKQDEVLVHRTKSVATATGVVTGP
jgi:dynein heavy chain